METIDFHRKLGELRPKLHRYCARMTGSAIDGEDVVQDALAKAVAAFSDNVAMVNIDGWLFRIAHNAALDFLRRRVREQAARTEEDIEMIAEASDPTAERASAAASLRTFMELPVVQRSSVILMDVLGYTVREVATILDGSVPAVKSALHRGRARLDELARLPAEPAASLSPAERARLHGYVERFNARDFDALRELLAEDVRLELVNHRNIHGRKEVGSYFTNYARIDDWLLVPGLVDRRPAVLVRDPDEPTGRPRYFILLAWDGPGLVTIRDFRYARYVLDEAEIVSLA